jgi:hypothetical protein
MSYLEKPEQFIDRYAEAAHRNHDVETKNDETGQLTDVPAKPALPNLKRCVLLSHQAQSRPQSACSPFRHRLRARAKVGVAASVRLSLSNRGRGCKPSSGAGARQSCASRDQGSRGLLACVQGECATSDTPRVCGLGSRFAAGRQAGKRSLWGRGVVGTRKTIRNVKACG